MRLFTFWQFTLSCCTFHQSSTFDLFWHMILMCEWARRSLRISWLSARALSVIEVDSKAWLEYWLCQSSVLPRQVKFDCWSFEPKHKKETKWLCVLASRMHVWCGDDHCMFFLHYAYWISDMYIVLLTINQSSAYSISALTLLVGWQEGHPAHGNL